MPDQTRKQLRRATIVFWILLFYIIAALVWWLISLEQQSKQIHELQKQQVQTSTTNNKTELIATITKNERRESVKYIAEGVVFLLLILFGAVYIYRLVRRQFQLQQQQQNFVMAVTHELKTPISVARLNLETLQKHQLDAEKQKKLLNMTLQETMRLDTLINNILLSSQLDAEAYKAAKEELNFSALVKDVCNQFQSRYTNRNLVISIEDDVELTGDPLLLKLLVSNLLENANKYSERSTTIYCILDENDQKINLQITDEGYGIRDEEKMKVFTKFYRIGNEDTRTTKGTGLGLFISKKIVESHQGVIEVKDNHPKGTIFTVTFESQIKQDE